MIKLHETFMLVLAILGILGGAIGTLAMLTFGLAAGANSSPEEILKIKLFLLIVIAFGLIIIGGGVALIYYGYPGLAVIVGILPLAVVVGWMIVLGIHQSMQ